ncbi:uncharacterized protein LOC119165807 isoform X2 [Rhipicephalus microplus]|uniref:uncharacterized protein LOC119165807 isoform X2 n=1 Tax=Rhipicephalus microplus TaxID=6941 RepID=UPI003F6ADC57
MGNRNINTVLALFLVVATCKASEIEGLVGPPDSLPSKPEESNPPADTSPKEDATGPKAFLPLARIPGYDERCNVQVTTTNEKCRSTHDGKKRRKGWYLDPATRKCLPSCDKNAPFRFKIHCNGICRTERACHFEATSFPCGFRAMHPIFVYNRAQKKCVKAYDCDYYGNKFVTLKECLKTCVKGGIQGPPGGDVSGSPTSLPTPPSMPTQGRQPSPPPSALLPGPEPQVPQIVPSSLPQPSANGAGTSSQVSTQRQKPDLSTLEQPPPLPPSPLLSLGGNQISMGKPPSIGAPSISHTTGQGSSPSAPVRPGQVSPGSSIVLSSELEIVGAGTGPMPTPVTTASSLSDTSGESLSLDLGLRGPRRPLSTGGTSVSRINRRPGFGIPASLGRVPDRFGASLKPELEIVAVRTGRMPRPPSAPGPNRRRTRTSRTRKPKKSGSTGLGEAESHSRGTASVPPFPGEIPGAGVFPVQRRPSWPTATATSPGTEVPEAPRVPARSPGANAQNLGGTMIPGMPHPALSVPPSFTGPSLTGTTGQTAPEPSNLPDNLDLGLTTVGAPSPTGLTRTSVSNTPASGLTEGNSKEKQGQLAGKLPAAPLQVPETSKGGFVKTVTSGNQYPSLPIKPAAPTRQKPSVLPIPPSNEDLLQTRPTTKQLGTSKEESIKPGTSAPEGASLPINPVSSVLQKPSLRPTPPLNQHLVPTLPKTQNIGTIKKGLVQTGTKSHQAPASPVGPIAPVLQKTNLPPTPPLEQNTLPQRPTTQKGGTTKEGPVKTGASGPEAPGLFVIHVKPTLPRPTLQHSPSLNENPMHKRRPRTQKIEYQVFRQGPLNDDRFVKKIPKVGNEGIKLPGS